MEVCINFIGPVNREHFPEPCFAQSIGYLHTVNIGHYQGGVGPCNLQLTQSGTVRGCQCWKEERSGVREGEGEGEGEGGGRCTLYM